MFKENFIVSYIAFWLKSSIAIDNNFVRLSNPNTILKLIPLGADNKSVPVNQLSTVEDNFKLDFGTLVWGIIITFVSFNLFGDMFLLGLILFIYGVATILSSFQVKLDLITTGGMIYSLEVVIFEKTKLMSIKPLIENMIGNRLDDTNVSANTDRVIDAMYHFNTMNNAQAQNAYNQIPGQNYSQVHGTPVNNLQEAQAVPNLENNMNYAQQAQPVMQNSVDFTRGQQVPPMQQNQMNSTVNPFGDQPVQAQQVNANPFGAQAVQQQQVNMNANTFTGQPAQLQQEQVSPMNNTYVNQAQAQQVNANPFGDQPVNPTQVHSEVRVEKPVQNQQPMMQQQTSVIKEEAPVAVQQVPTAIQEPKQVQQTPSAPVFAQGSIRKKKLRGR